MIRDEKTGTLRPFHLESVVKSIPSILELGIEVHAMELEEIMDSSNVTPAIWVELAEIIRDYYDQFDGFVILHGSDTMAYSASAMSFLLENLGKPVIFTGSQLPIGLPRTDARENLITALTIAGMKREDGRSVVPEVCIYFEDRLYRGNRTYKFNSENFDAFVSRNYPILAEAGVRIRIFDDRLLPHSTLPLEVHTEMSHRVGVLQLFPGLSAMPYADMFISSGMEAVILESYGSGNGPTRGDLIPALQKLTDHGILVLNITQCREGKVEMGKYETSVALGRMGILSGADLTSEAAITKAMFVLGLTTDNKTRKMLLETPLRGEMSP